MRHNNEALENSKSINENRQRLAEKESNKSKKYIEETNSFVKTYNKIRDKRVFNEREHGKLVEETRNNVFCDILKAIYITALEAEALTDNGLLLAESMVDNYVKDRGGALKILNPVKNNTYLLAKIANILEDTTEAEVKEIEDIKEEDDIEEAPASSEEDEAELVKKVIELGYTVSKDTKEEPAEAEAPEEPVAAEEPTEEPKTEEVPEDTPAEEPVGDVIADTEIEDDEVDDMALASGEVEVEDDTEEKVEEPEAETEEDNAPQTDTNEAPAAEVNDVEPAPEESEETPAEEPEEAESEPKAEEPAEDLGDEDLEGEEDEEPSQEELDAETPDGEFNDEDGDGEDDLDIDGDGEDDFGVDEPEDTVNVDPKKTMFQELEKEKEVKDAIELIRTRVADAEQAFINRNAADKEKINNLLNKISDNIKTVEKISDNDSDESKVAQESANLAKRRINEISSNRPLTIFEALTRNITANILKNEAVKENYITESGQLDTPVVVEAAKVMYGFLETLNTLQIESVNSDYVLSILKEFK